ncbi:MAG: hypothetical protein ACKVUS_18200 [Saprospiraceae bacterium]
MKKLILPILLLSAFATFSQESSVRFIEVSGTAERKVMADEYFFSVTVIPGEACQIPKKGRDWEKQLKDCKEENDKLIASRESILDAISGSYAGRIMKLSGGPIDKYGRPSINYKFSCRSYSDFQDFEDKLREIEKAFTIEMQYALSNSSVQIMEELTLESLTNAKEKAVKMSAALNERVGVAFHIYEDEPISTITGGLKKLLAGEMSKRGDYQSGGPSFLPNSDGKLYFSKTVYIRFVLL